MKGQKGRLRFGGISYLIVILTLIICSGCAKKETVRNMSDEEVLRDRVMAYWDQRVKEDFYKSYDFEDPIYKKKMSLVQYVKRLAVDPVRLKDVTIAGIQMEDGAAWVDLKTRIQVRAPGTPGPFTVDMERKDRWGKIEGVWYHVIDEPSAQSGDRK